ncbi:MAG TPA: hypothetical protein VLD62_13265 [Acidimicrobiia bacterium]|nr:hypothetical protein [Acidimicrobiia bacterium]
MRRVPLVLLVVVIAAACAGEGSLAPPTTPPATTSPPTATSSSADPPSTEGTIPIDGGRVVVTMTVDEEPRQALVVVPERLAMPASLVVVFHGFTGTSARVEAQSGLSDLAAEEGFVVAYPQGAGIVPSWRTSSLQGDEDVRFVEAVIDLVADAVPIERVLATGMSNGGGMAGRMACDRADLVDAVAPVAAAHPPTVCDPSEAVPILAFHAMDDRVVRYDGFGPLVFGQEEWAVAWARRNGCEPISEVSRVAEGVDTLTWGACDAPVILYRSATGGHRWPGPDAPPGSDAARFEASAVMWAWFDGIG